MTNLGDFRIFDFVLYSNQKLGNFSKLTLTLNFGSSWNWRFKNEKKKERNG